MGSFGFWLRVTQALPDGLTRSEKLCLGLVGLLFYQVGWLHIGPGRFWNWAIICLNTDGSVLIGGLSSLVSLLCWKPTVGFKWGIWGWKNGCCTSWFFSQFKTVRQCHMFKGDWHVCIEGYFDLTVWGECLLIGWQTSSNIFFWNSALIKSFWEWVLLPLDIATWTQSDAWGVCNLAWLFLRKDMNSVLIGVGAIAAFQKLGMQTNFFCIWFK